MKQNYRIRAMAARDPRFGKIATRLGYGTRDMVADRSAPAEDIADVRAEYKRVVGKQAYNGWDIPTLRQKMAEAKDKG
jgi:hypothetical protein